MHACRAGLQCFSTFLCVTLIRKTWEGLRDEAVFTVTATLEYEPPNYSLRWIEAIQLQPLSVGLVRPVARVCYSHAGDAIFFSKDGIIVHPLQLSYYLQPCTVSLLTFFPLTVYTSSCTTLSVHECNRPCKSEGGGWKGGQGVLL